MTPAVLGDACAIAAGSISALGAGRDAYRVAFPGERARCALAPDPILAQAGLVRPTAARAQLPAGADAGGDRATALLRFALAQACAGLDGARPGWRAERVGVAIGTSSGGMLTAERFFEARERGPVPQALARGATYFAPLDAALEALDLAAAFPRTQVLAACAASTIALGLGLRWLDRGACDLVLAGGYDALSVFVAAGFEVLRATTATRPRPFCTGRDGMSLGEGAGVVALVRAGDTRGVAVLARLAGFGASTDAVHITAPDRTGRGLARAGAAALADAGLDGSQIGLVSAHATATPYNDAMEAKAIASLVPGSPGPVVHPFKAQIGHTLGAAGVLEALAAADALAAQVAPAAASGGDALDPEASVALLERAEPRVLHAALKLSAAFGGTNAALVLAAGPTARPSRPSRPAYLRAFAAVASAELPALAEATGVPRDRLARLDPLCRLGLGAVAALAAQLGREALVGAGIVAGHALATLDTNDVFAARLRAKGPPLADPRLFPATSPNALAGECAIVYQLTGPGFSVGAGLGGALEALACAAELVAAGDAERMVVVAADDVGPASRALLEAAGWRSAALERGAVAVLLQASPEGALREVPLPTAGPGASSGARDAGPIGHLALLQWLENGVPAAGSPPRRP